MLLGILILFSLILKLEWYRKYSFEFWLQHTKKCTEKLIQLITLYTYSEISGVIHTRIVRVERPERDDSACGARFK